MAGGRYLLDTNILLYLLGGKLTGKDLPEGKYFVSFITELETLSYPDLTSEDESKLHDAFAALPVLDLDGPGKLETVRFRREHRLRLPDAIIAGICKAHGLTLVSADLDFKKLGSELPVVLLPPEKLRQA